jgi:S1-C subfamily serine protease
LATGIGVYISRIEEGSVAERSGLRPGDTILEVNGTPFSGMTHDEALAVNEMLFSLLFFNVHVECAWWKG